MFTTGNFAFPCVRQRYADALRTLEQNQGDGEAETLEHHVSVVPHRDQSALIFAPEKAGIHDGLSQVDPVGTEAKSFREYV